MGLEFYQVDAFASEPFRGNPACVCITAAALPEQQMLSIAGELAVSETAFLTLEDMRLRWFTPKVEVKLCGHGTLAVAHVLKAKGLTKVGDILTFQTLSGPLLATVGETTIALDLPASRLSSTVPVDMPLIRRLGLPADQVTAFATFEDKVLIEVANEDTVLDLNPDFHALKEIAGRGVAVTALSARCNIDFVSRYFAPWVGVDEDPVTGSAHCALTQHWASKLGKTAFHAYQASARGGYLHTELLPDHRIRIIGTAKTVIKGDLYV